MEQKSGVKKKWYAQHDLSFLAPVACVFAFVGGTTPNPWLGWSLITAAIVCMAVWFKNKQKNKKEQEA